MAPAVTVCARALVIPAFVATGDIISRLGVSVVTGLLDTGNQGEDLLDPLKGFVAVDLEKKAIQVRKEEKGKLLPSSHGYGQQLGPRRRRSRQDASEGRSECRNDPGRKGK